MKHKIRKMIPCYYGFFNNGMMVLVIGAILPYLISEEKLSYSVAGGFLSAMALGNLFASFIMPLFLVKLKRRMTTILLTSLIPIFLFMIVSTSVVPVIYVSFLMVGIGRGSVSIINNTVANENGASAAEINLLHTMFAIGAFLAPFLTVLYINCGLNWKYVMYTVIILSAISTIGFYHLPYKSNENVDKISDEENNTFKSHGFIIISLILFFYIGVENCVNGWFVTYFKSSGIMSDSYATNLVSVTWFLIMIGRLTNAYISTKISKQKLIFINCFFAIIFFLLLITTRNLVIITIAVAGLGFFFAGIYPTCIANACEFINGSAVGMSILLAISALGGIITPQIVGILADIIGITAAVGFLIISILLMGVFATINMVKHRIVEI